MKIKGLILLMLGVWLGMVLGISFLEAPLKFRAPNITLTLGLGIGQLVFSALNKIEIIFSILLFIWLGNQYKTLEWSMIFIAAVPLLLVALQSFWLLPILNTRVDHLRQGLEVANSHHHFYYIAGEILKTIFLFFGFIKLYSLD